MKYAAIDAQIFIENRINFIGKMLPDSVAIFNSNDAMPTNADGTMGFKQNSDLFYLCGIDQEETTLVLFPCHPQQEMQEILFVKETNEHIAIWEGSKLSKSQATDVSGIPNVYWSHQMEGVIKNLVFEVENIYLNANEHSRADSKVATQSDRFISWCQSKFPLHKYYRAALILQSLRMIKSSKEVALVQKACDVTEKAFRRILPFIKPGVWEYEIEAEIIHEFMRNRSRGPAYASIIASGENACVLHYIDNNKKCLDGQLLLMDFGAEYANYAADLTRSVPVNGRFTPRQKEVYQAVQRILTQAQQLLQVGTEFKDYNATVVKFVEEELLNLQLFSIHDLKNQDPKHPLYKKYFMHGISHYLGLDVHDVGSRNVSFKEGMLLTCEPGIYIREEGLGIRLENDILLTAQGPENLMKNIPIEVEEIENLMNR